MAELSLKAERFVSGDDGIANPWSRIFCLLLINVTLTFTMELLWRELMAPLTSDPSATGFFVANADGFYMINRQSLINITMTAFATVVGSWVMFGRRRVDRFWGFILSGIAIAVVAQFSVNIFTGAAIIIGFNRVIFDIFYTCAIKFPMFEWGRKALIASHASVFMLFIIRLIQDASMSAIRIGLLNQFEIY